MKTVIFDFDGTLADTFPIIMGILNVIGKYYGLPLVKESEYPEYRKMGVMGLMKKFNMSKLKLIIFAIHIKYLMKKDIKSIKLFNGAKELINKLNNKGYSVKIFSSNTQGNIITILKNNGIENLPKVCTEISLVDKGIGLKKLLKKENLANKDTLYVGDEVRDYYGANNANVGFLGVDWGFNSKEGLTNAGVKDVVSSMDELYLKIEESLKNSK